MKNLDHVLPVKVTSLHPDAKIPSLSVKGLFALLSLLEGICQVSALHNWLWLEFHKSSVSESVGFSTLCLNCYVSGMTVFWHLLLCAGRLRSVGLLKQTSRIKQECVGMRHLDAGEKTRAYVCQLHLVCCLLIAVQAVLHLLWYVNLIL